MVESLGTRREAEKLKIEKAGRMGAMEQVSGEGDETDGVNSNNKKGEAMMSNTMRRATSVDDLFAPLWQLNVQSSCTPRSNDPPAPYPSASSAAASSSAKAPVPQAPVPHASRIAEGGASSSVSSVAVNAECKERSTNGTSSPPPLSHSSAGSIANDRDSQRVVAESRVQQSGKNQPDGVKRTGRDRQLEGSSSSYSSEPDAGDVKPSIIAPEADHYPFGAKRESKGTTGKASSGDAPDPLPPSNSTSDDDQHAGGVDERKQKRMLSNRESARRSRLRKQQHLDELRAQVAHLRAENNHMMTKYSIASQRYVTLTDENQRLRSHAMDLSRQLQRLHHTASQHPGGLRALGLQTGHLDPVPFGSMSSGHHSPYSQPMVPDMLH